LICCHHLTIHHGQGLSGMRIMPWNRGLIRCNCKKSFLQLQTSEVSGQ